MTMERLDALRSKFDNAMEMLKRAKDIHERHTLLKHLRAIIAEAEGIVLESQKDLRDMRERLRSLQ